MATTGKKLYKMQRSQLYKMGISASTDTASTPMINVAEDRATNQEVFYEAVSPRNKYINRTVHVNMKVG